MRQETFDLVDEKHYKNLSLNYIVPNESKNVLSMECAINSPSAVGTEGTQTHLNGSRKQQPLVNEHRVCACTSRDLFA